MFWLASSSRVTVLERKLQESEKRVYQLESLVTLMNANISALQSAMLSSTKTQEAMSYDVSRISELITAILEASEIDSFGGSGTMH